MKTIHQGWVAFLRIHYSEIFKISCNALFSDFRRCVRILRFHRVARLSVHSHAQCACTMLLRSHHSLHVTILHESSLGRTRINNDALVFGGSLPRLAETRASASTHLPFARSVIWHSRHLAFVKECECQMYIFIRTQKHHYLGFRRTLGVFSIFASCNLGWRAFRHIITIIDGPAVHLFWMSIHTQLHFFFEFLLVLSFRVNTVLSVKYSHIGRILEIKNSPLRVH